ncbi:MAG: nuclease domain-containing protein [Pseudomonadota bacterium]
MSMIRDAAKGQTCSLRLIPYCDDATVVLAHISADAMGRVASKQMDIHGAFACSRCHDIIDLRGDEWKRIEPHLITLRKLAGLIETQRILVDMGLIEFKGELK